MGLNDTGRPGYQTFANQGTDIDTHQYQRLRAAQYDVTASRAIGTTYRNTSGKIIFVTVTVVHNNTSSWSAKCDLNAAPTTVVAQQQTGAAVTNDIRCASFVVPVNFYYKISDDGGTKTLLSWIEWAIF